MQRRRHPRALVALSLVLVGLFAAPAHAHPGHEVAPSGEGFAATHGFSLNPFATGARAAGSHLGPEIVTLAAAVPRAECGPGSKPETDLQGRVPLADYESGRADEGYTCNIELVGRHGTTGGYQVHRYVDTSGRECGYYDSTLLWGADIVKAAEPGVYVLDMTDPAAPVRTAVLRTPAMQSPHESLRLNAERGLLVANMGSPITNAGFVDVYDVSADCRDPQLRSSLPLALLGHEGGFSPDGRTYWATTTSTPGIVAIDVTDPSLPAVVWRSEQYAVHGLSLSADGTRAYLAHMDRSPASAPPGLLILDVSEIQERVPDPQVREVGALTWPEVTIPQNSNPVTIGGRRHLVQYDEFSSNVYNDGPAHYVGGVRIIDIEDEAQPRIVSRIRLEVHQQEARAGAQQHDPGAHRTVQGYAAHYCAVPREVEPGLVACGMIASGLRVFDIRDPANPREVAYFNQPLTDLSNPARSGGYAMAAAAFVPERGEIWHADGNAGFFVLRLTGAARELLDDSAPTGSEAAETPAAPGVEPAGEPLPATGGSATVLLLGLAGLWVGVAGRRGARAAP